MGGQRKSENDLQDFIAYSARKNSSFQDPIFEEKKGGAEESQRALPASLAFPSILLQFKILRTTKPMFFRHHALKPAQRIVKLTVCVIAYVQ